MLNCKNSTASTMASSGRALRPMPALGARKRYLRPVAVVATEAPPTRATTSGPIILNGQVLHSITEERLDVVRGMGNYIETAVTPLLKPVDKCWQPSDFLPRPEDADFFDQVEELRKRTTNLPDDYLVVFAGDLITEEALPTYMTMLNTLDGVRDETGASQTPWAKWTREWTAEENRHGDAMNKYMYLTGRMNMRAVEVTIQKLIGSGMDPKTENNPYLGFTYTSFQERATKISHGNTARHALDYGDEVLAKLAGAIASDESRHEMAYSKIMDEVFRIDPCGGVLAFADMMKKQIVMPAHMMNDGEHEAQTGRKLFADFAAVAERTGTYTAQDYADIMEHLIKRWNIANLTGLSGEAAAAQEYLMKLPKRIRGLAEKTLARRHKASAGQTAPFSWIFNREVVLVG